MTRRYSPHPYRLSAVLCRRLLSALLLVLATAAEPAAAELPLLTVRAATLAHSAIWEGQIQAQRQVQIAAQVPGRIVELNVHAGDSVRAGDVLLRLDASGSQQQAAASQAQVAAAQAALDLATSELARKRELAARKYISQGALELAQSQYRTARAQVNALQGQAHAAQTQAGLHVIRAPWDATVADTLAELGDMAQPGRSLLVLYDPSALRVSAHVPTSALAGNAAHGEARVLIGGTSDLVQVHGIQLMPTVDALSLTQEVRAPLPAGTPAVPGQFARLQLSAPAPASQEPARIFIPVSSIVRRAEVTAVYTAQPGRPPQLRQLRLGPVLGDEVEVLAGLDVGEQIVTDPQAAVRALSEARSRGRAQ